MGCFQDSTHCLNLFNLPVAISAVSQSQVIMLKTPSVAFNYRSDISYGPKGDLPLARASRKHRRRGDAVFDLIGGRQPSLSLFLRENESINAAAFGGLYE